MIDGKEEETGEDKEAPGEAMSRNGADVRALGTLNEI